MFYLTFELVKLSFITVDIPANNPFGQPLDNSTIASLKKSTIVPLGNLHPWVKGLFRTPAVLLFAVQHVKTGDPYFSIRFIIYVH